MSQGARAISVAGDFRGLKQAARELMEEARSAPERERIEKLMRHAAAPDGVLLATGVNRSLAEGYYSRVGYLLELETFLNMCSNPGFNLNMAELRGILSIRAARAEFDRAHPPCRGCGKRLENEWDQSCNDCQRAAAAAGRS
jgi:hypothetical protein